MLINSYMASTHQNWLREVMTQDAEKANFCHILDQLQHIWLQSFQSCSISMCVQYQHVNLWSAMKLQRSVANKLSKKLIGENQQFLDELQEYSLRRKPKEDSKENELKQNFCLFHQVSAICPKAERKEIILLLVVTSIRFYPYS